MGWHFEWAVAIVFVGGGCGPVVGSGDDRGESGTGSETGASSSGNSTSASTSSSTTASTSSTSSTTSVDPTTTTDGSDTSTDGGSFLSPTGGVIGVECSTFSPEDCPEDRKCMPFDVDGDGAWDEAECFPLDPDAVGVGEPCQAIGGPVSGLDDCPDGAMCFDVDAGGAGTCVPFCDGTQNAPFCEDPDDTCTDLNEHSLHLCLTRCDPTDPGSCEAGHGCAPGGGPAGFACVPMRTIASASGEPCSYANDCIAGFTCLAPEFLGACDPGDAAGCCTPFCDATDAGGQCPAAAEACQPMVPFFGFEHYGICATVDAGTLNFIEWIAP